MAKEWLRMNRHFKKLEMGEIDEIKEDFQEANKPIDFTWSAHLISNEWDRKSFADMVKQIRDRYKRLQKTFKRGSSTFCNPQRKKRERK